MKQYFIPLIIVILLVGTGCKKYKLEDKPPTQPATPPSIEKKWVVTTVAGDGSAYFGDGPALMAKFRAPQDVAVTADGIIYVADALNHRIRKIAGGQVTTFAGFDMEDTASGTGTAAGFAHPIQVVSDQAGNLYTLDVSDYRVRKITPGALVTVAAGNGIRGFADGRVDTAKFGESLGIVTDDEGNIFVSDWENRRIRKISVSGQVTTIAGPAQLGSVGGITIDKQGNLYVVDWGNFRILKITSGGDVSTFAGTGTPGNKDGNADEAQFSINMNDIVIDDHGNLFLADDSRIRKITAQGVVSTIAGSTIGYRDGNGTSAKFNLIAGLGIDKQGNIYAADDNNNRIRKISFE
jgi:sugar lactone lactonase YvrE